MDRRGKFTIPALWQESVEEYAKNNALSVVGEKPKTFEQVHKEINSLIAFLEKLGVKKGDKIAILSSNMPNWGITFLSLNMMGVIGVPLLPDFSVIEIETILNHSEAEIIFVSDSLKTKLAAIKSEKLNCQIRIEDFSILLGPEIIYQQGEVFTGQYDVEEDDLASIIYTSGTTGTSKGVMLTHKNITHNAYYAGKIQEIKDTDRFLSILPLSHTYENTIGFVLPMIKGACVYYLLKPPTPAVLLPALQKVKPTIMLSVPLVIEKIFRNKVLKEINGKFITRLLYRSAFFRKKMNALAGKKLYETFGGELVFFGIGGAKLDEKVEAFLREAKFPYAIGYGLTETAPLVAGVNPTKTRLQSTGPSVQGVEIKINNPDLKTGEGEIWVKGPNVMKGYYKEPELTKQAFSEDGWFKTGDLGIFDSDQFLFIKGRLKNMIVGSSGENIYPEEIESIINNFKYVVESLVIEKKGKLVAMVHFNKEELETKYQHLREEVSKFVDHKMDELREELHIYINSRVNKFSRVQLVMVQAEPFQKTATHKIKRFLY